MLMEAPRSLRNASVGRGETMLVVWSCKQRDEGLCLQAEWPWVSRIVLFLSSKHHTFSNLLSLPLGDPAFFVFAVSELQEEGMNAINLPLSPIPFELDPEDTMLGNWVSCFSWDNPDNLSGTIPTDFVFVLKRRMKFARWWIQTHAVTPNFKNS